MAHRQWLALDTMDKPMGIVQSGTDKNQNARLTFAESGLDLRAALQSSIAAFGRIGVHLSSISETN